MSKPDTITITMARYTQLLQSEEQNDALEAAGVDNWDGYSEAIASCACEAEDIAALVAAHIERDRVVPS